MSILFINACVRNNSRTLVVANKILSERSDEIVEVTLNQENIPPLNQELLKKREKLWQKYPQSFMTIPKESLP